MEDVLPPWRSGHRPRPVSHPAAAGSVRAMGVRYYGADGAAIRIDDGSLTLLRAVLLVKLHRHECLAVTLLHPTETSLWFHVAVPWRIVLDSSRAPEVPQAVVEGVLDEASTLGRILL